MIISPSYVRTETLSMSSTLLYLSRIFRFVRPHATVSFVVYYVTFLDRPLLKTLRLGLYWSQLQNVVFCRGGIERLQPVASPALSPIQATMTHDSTPHHIFRIDELTRLIASQLVLISRQSTVNLACACRSLEEPNLSTLWETQSSMSTLLGVLPKETWKVRYLEYGERVVRGLNSPLEGLKV